MKCPEFESALADYIDGTLSYAERSAVEAHAVSCAGCRELMQDATGIVDFLNRVERVLPPPQLVTRIAYQAPLGRTPQPFEIQGILSSLASKWLQPLLQPRLAMGMAMTLLSFAMLERCTGIRVQHLQTADLSPVKIWDGLEDRALRVRDRAQKYYENIRWVYDIETFLRELEEQQAAADEQNTRRGGARQNSEQNTNQGHAIAPAQRGNDR
ncbi:MAG: zf-HC2 domain-containing protein [Acidobacteriaceae bacterium]|nr:zf-HC2 domain-containing protein [Acidobacteriaceae bacterium]